MERDYIGVNVVNFITIGIMAFFGMALVGMAASLVRQQFGGAATTDTAGE